MKLAFFLVSVLVAACFVSAQPASAAVTATFAITSANPYSGPCPVTLNFSGSITNSGASAVSVTYVFARFVNNTSIDSAPINATVPAGGNLPVSQALSVDQANSGFQSYGLYFTTPPDVQVTGSHKQFFTVTCGPSVLKPSPPSNLNNTTFASTCAQHGGLAGLFCPDALHNGYLVLVWDYSNTGAVDGYHVFETDGGQNTQVDDQKNSQLTVSFLKPPSSGFAGRCYVVTAYKNGVDSPPSNSFCEPSRYVISPNSYLGGHGSPNILTMTAYTWDYRYSDYKCPLCMGGEYGFKCDTLCVGFTHYKTGDSITLNHEITTWRSYLNFNWTTKLRALNVYKATLTMSMQGDPSCYGGIGPSLSAWQGNSNYVQGDFSYNEPHTVAGSLFTIDVTAIVRDWATGKVPYFGFVMNGSNENGLGADNISCQVYFSSPSLSIEHY